MTTEQQNARLASLKPGDVVHTSSGFETDSAWRVVSVVDGGILAYKAAAYYLPTPVLFMCASEIVWPDPPKAKPGVVYRRKSSGCGERVGTVDGRLFSGYYDAPYDYIDYHPDWVEVSE